MGTGTLDVLAFPLLRPRGGLRRGGEGGGGRRGAGEGGPGVYLVTVSGPAGHVRGLAVSVAVATPLEAAGLLPHEQVDPRSVRKRLRAWRGARVDREPVLLTHAGGGAAVTAAAVDEVELFRLEATGTAVTVSRVRDDLAGSVIADLSSRTALVADGHHRLAAAAMYAAAAGSLSHRAPLGGAGRAAADSRARVTALVVDADDTPLSVRPIHRVLSRRRPVLTAREVVAALVATRPAPVRVGDPGAPVTARPPGSAVPGGPPDAVVVDREGSTPLWFGDGLPDPVLPSSVHAVELALAALGPDSVARLRDTPDAEAMARGRGVVAVLLPAVPQDRVLAAVTAGTLLPVKATSFEPKLPAGVLLRPLSPA